MTEPTQPIIIGADHFGLSLKDILRDYIRAQGYAVEDIGVNDATPVDYPDIAEKLAARVARGEFERGILICGTGAGMAIVANKVPGVRAVAVTDPYLAERARASNNAQIITLGSQVTTPEVAKKLIDIWLQSEFQGGRSAPKVAKMDQVDAKYRRRSEGQE
ncbi:MAG: RpiB/LacA/LacB family sugar-phosphate isomerase [Anaerolineales bacterium]|nr:RpiB/LacA/LacB family sugar-phosphate isomerase [Anaerolineales bacterium]